MYIIKYLKIALLIILICISTYLIILNNNLKKDNARLNSNVSQLELYNNNSKLLLTKDEFLKFKSDLINEITDSLNIKPKQITNVINTYNSYIDSSKSITNTNQISDSIYRITVDEGCFGFSGIHNIKSKQFTLDYRRFNDTIRIIDYWYRKRLFNKQWLPKIGKKRYLRDSYSKCNSKVTTEEINIIKK